MPASAGDLFDALADRGPPRARQALPVSAGAPEAEGLVVAPACRNISPDQIARQARWSCRAQARAQLGFGLGRDIALRFATSARPGSRDRPALASPPRADQRSCTRTAACNSPASKRGCGTVRLQAAGSDMAASSVASSLIIQGGVAAVPGVASSPRPDRGGPRCLRPAPPAARFERHVGIAGRADHPISGQPARQQKRKDRDRRDRMGSPGLPAAAGPVCAPVRLEHPACRLRPAVCQRRPG
jgi:hypothetical protein